MYQEATSVDNKYQNPVEGESLQKSKAREDKNHMSEKSKGESIRRKIEKLPATFFIRLQSLSFLIAVVVVVVKF